MPQCNGDLTNVLLHQYLTTENHIFSMLTTKHCPVYKTSLQKTLIRELF